MTLAEKKWLNDFHRAILRSEGYREAMEDIRLGRVTKWDNIDEIFCSIDIDVCKEKRKKPQWVGYFFDRKAHKFRTTKRRH